MNSAGNDMDHDRVVTIILSSVLSVVATVTIATSAYLWHRKRSRKQVPFFRGISPIDDNEIHSWRVSRNGDEEKMTGRPRHDSNTSTFSHHKTPSLIQYQCPGRSSVDASSPLSPKSMFRSMSMEIPQSPPSVVLAKAPNARIGLTDETILGDSPFVQQPRRQQGRLQKGAARHKGSRSSSIKSFGDIWVRDNGELPMRRSADIPTRGHSRIYSTSSVPPHRSFVDAEAYMSTFRAAPLYTESIGRAIG